MVYNVEIWGKIGKYGKKIGNFYIIWKKIGYLKKNWKFKNLEIWREKNLESWKIWYFGEEKKLKFGNNFEIWKKKEIWKKIWKYVEI